MNGKKILNHVYWHCSLNKSQDEIVQSHIAEAESLTNLHCDTDYNVIKYNIDGQSLSLLFYDEFFSAPFPVLKHSHRIDLVTKRIEKRNYSESLNPPILHRKELLISKDDPRLLAYKEITATAEQLGLFDNEVSIGYQQSWESLILSKGFKLISNEFVPIGNVDDPEEQTFDLAQTQIIPRHLTALSRDGLSAPLQCLARHGFLKNEVSVFDYGCGKGDDVRNLVFNGISASGWDPHYAPDEPKKIGDIVNLGFVINVIENYEERVQALVGAYDLCRVLLVVSTMLFNQNTRQGLSYNDGVITQRKTFQKYYTQAELKAFLTEQLETDAIPVAPGIFYIFKDKDVEQRFLLNRQRNRRNITIFSKRRSSPQLPKLSRNEKKYLSYQHLIDQLWQQSLELGRFPDKTEISNQSDLIAGFGSVRKALQLMLSHFDESLLEAAKLSKIDDLLTYFALQTFSKRKTYKNLEPTLRIDISIFFNDYKNAIATAQSSLYQISNSELITSLCIQASERGLGYLDYEEALHVHTSYVAQLPAVLRIYIRCATVLYGDLEQTDIIKIHSKSGKLSLMRYDDFENKPLPELLERVKINLREQSFDIYQYGDEFEPTYLYLKSRYINEEFKNYAEQLAFDEQIQALGLFDLTGYGPKPNAFKDALVKSRLEINGFELIRSQQIPDIDALCGSYFRFRDFIECGETQAKTGIQNYPVQPDSYNALYDLAVNVLDPVIDYYGMIRLTYGFCSHELGKHIKSRVAPKLDQHAAHERNSKNNLICSRLGAAVDFIVDDENMREVADWIASNTDFDRLYFYGDDRPIHVSYGPEHKKEYVDLLLTEQGRLIPKIRY